MTKATKIKETTMINNRVDDFYKHIQQQLNMMDPSLKEKYENFQKEIPRRTRNLNILIAAFVCDFLVCAVCMISGRPANCFVVLLFPMFFILILTYMWFYSRFIKKAQEITDETGLPWTPSLKLLRKYPEINRYPSPWMRRDDTYKWQTPQSESSTASALRTSFHDDSSARARNYDSSRNTWDSNANIPHRDDRPYVSPASSSYDSSRSTSSSSSFNPSTGLPMCGGIDTSGNPYGGRR
jgi:hypothetical protein